MKQIRFVTMPRYFEHFNDILSIVFVSHAMQMSGKWRKIRTCASPYGASVNSVYAGCGASGYVPEPPTLAKTVFCCEHNVKPCAPGGSRAPLLPPCVMLWPPHRDACGSELTLHLFILVIRLHLTVYPCVSPMSYLHVLIWNSHEKATKHS